MLAREGFTAGAQLVRALDLRYIGQQWDIRVLLPAAALDGDALDAADVRRRFEIEHDRLFGHIQPDGIIEIAKLRITGIGALPPLSLPSPRPASGIPGPIERRRVWIDRTTGWVTTPVFDGSALHPGQRVDGPAIVNEATTTVLIGAGDRLEVDAAGNFMIALRATDASVVAPEATEVVA